jgi:hypothetical protein
MLHGKDKNKLTNSLAEKKEKAKKESIYNRDIEELTKQPFERTTSPRKI